MIYATPEEEIAAEFETDKVVKLQPAVPSRLEVALIMLAASQAQLLYYVIVHLLYACGPRVGELSHLQCGDILWHDQILFVPAGKGPKDRYVLIDAGTLACLKQLHPNTICSTR